MASQGPAIATSIRFRPAILLGTGLAAVLGSYLLYHTVLGLREVPAPKLGLHRSNAIHRSSRRRTGSRTIAFIQHRHSVWAECLVTHGDHTYTFDTSRGAPDQTSLANELELTAEQSSSYLLQIEQSSLKRIFQTILHYGQPPDVVHSDLNLQDTLSERSGEIMLELEDVFTRGRWQFSKEAFFNAVVAWCGQDPSTTGLGQLMSTAHGDRDETTTVGSMPDGEEGDDGGQSLNALLYHIAEEEAQKKAFVHRGTRCDSCNTLPITGIRWHCINCPDFDLCSTCEAKNEHIRTHIFAKIKIPICTLSQPRDIQKTWYPGRHLRSPPPSLTPEERRGVMQICDLEEAQVNAFYDQFLCLSVSVYDSSKGTATMGIDRVTFRKAFMSEASGNPLEPNYLFDRMFDFYNQSKTGTITFAEFVTGLAFLLHHKKRTSMLRIFNGYDEDQDGYVSRADMVRMLRAKYKIHQAMIMDVVNVEDEQPRYTPRDHTDPSAFDLSTQLQSHRPISAMFRDHGIPPGETRRSFTKPSDKFGDPQTLPDELYSRAVLPNGETDMDVTFWNAVFNRYGRPSRLSDLHPEFNTRLDARQEVRDRYVGAESYDLGDDESRIPRRSLVKADNRHARPLNLDRQSLGKAWREDISRAQDGANERKEDAGARRQDTFETDQAFPVATDEVYLGEQVLYQVTEDAWNELLDPLFRDREQQAGEALHSQDDRAKYRNEIDTFIKQRDGYVVEAETDAQATTSPDHGANHNLNDKSNQPSTVFGNLQGRERRSTTPSPDLEAIVPEDPPQLTQQDVVARIQSEGVPTDLASLDAMERDIREQDLQSLLNSAGFSVRPGDEGTMNNNGMLDAHNDPDPRSQESTNVSAAPLEQTNGSRGEPSVASDQDSNWISASSASDREVDAMDVDDVGKEALQELPWTPESVRRRVESQGTPIHGQKQPAGSGSADASAPSSPPEGSPVAAKSVDAWTDGHVSMGNSSPSVAAGEGGASDASGETQYKRRGSESQESEIDSRAPNANGSVLQPGAETSKAAAEPSLEQLEMWALHDTIEAQIKERGGPARINLDEFEAAVLKDDQEGEGLRLRRLVENWLEWAGF